MLNLIPAVKSLTEKIGFLGCKAFCYAKAGLDSRLLRALEKLPYDACGAKLTLTVGSGTAESYTLRVEEDSISIESEGVAGAFYAIQTLRQLLTHDRVPCLVICDKPDFAYRGFYHDVTRGKLPTLETLKSLVDQMAYYKLNSLQLYIEHTFALEEYKDIHPTTGCYTARQMAELDAYCKENFVELIPSLSTFGHLYELLNQEKYRHLAIVKDYANPNVWSSRMRHHTIDPLHPDSIQVIGHMIDQTAPAFSSPWFNICCDETFDLKEYAAQGEDPGQLYVDFVKQIANHTRHAGKQVMMWADILLKHPETIGQLSHDICFLNWNYNIEPPETQVAALAKTGKQQIVCPGTATWNRLCEGVEREEGNICRMAEYGYKYGAVGVLNTNWGDWGNLCSLELSMYGMVLGAAKSWSVTTQPGNAFYAQVDALLYKQEHAMTYLTRLSSLQDQVNWLYFIRNYHKHRYANQTDYTEAVTAPVEQIQRGCRALADELGSQTWVNDPYRQEMLVAAEGICLIAELNAKIVNTPCTRTTNARKWLESYGNLWRSKNDPNELWRIEEILLYLEDM